MRAPALLLGALLITAASAQTATSPESKKLKGLEKDYVAAKAALAKKPKDKKVRDAFVKAGTLYGHECVVSPVLPARVKYRHALKIYREVLKVDPKQPIAKKESDMIIAIYKQMGRPVPE